MSDLELNKQNEQRDTMDGGFAVVDRERLIEEETREVTPWFMHFIHVFTAPSKMMEECFSVEPTKGGSVGVVGCLLFTTIMLLVNFFNPVMKASVLDAWRSVGIAEDSLNQMYSGSMIGGTIGGVIGVFIMALVNAVLFQIIKVILKDQCKFGTIYKMILLATMVTAAVQCVDAIAAYFIGMSGNIFSISILLSDEMKATTVGKMLSSLVSLGNIISIVYMVIGYKEMTHTTLKKGITAVAIVEIISIIGTYFLTSAASSLTATAAAMQ